MVEGRPGKHGAAGGPAAGGETEGTGLTGVAPPELPPFWVEWGRQISRKWPLPVFALAVVASVAFLLARPKGEKARPWEEYVRDAEFAFRMAVIAQDERGDVLRAVEFLAGENVKELAAARRKMRAEKGAEGAESGMHGVLPSYDRAIRRAGISILTPADFARIGESYYRLARIKQDYPDGAGRSISMFTAELYRRAAAYLDTARAEARASIQEASRENQERSKRLAAELEGPGWRRRRCMWAECQVYIGEYRRAIAELELLIEAMNAAEAQQLFREKDPRGSSAGAAPSGGPGEIGRDAAEWARVYELLARCHDRLGDYVQAARNYRLFLEQGAGGLLSHRARVRLANLIMDRSIGEGDAARAGVGFGEVAALCRRVEQSDAPGDLREDATFLRGRASYRLGMLSAEPAGARKAFDLAARAFRYPYSPKRRYVEMSRVLLARSLFLGGRRSEALEMLDSVLQFGARPVILACAEVSRADMFVESDPAQALGGRINSKRVTVRLVLGEGNTVAQVLGLRLKDVSSDLAAALGLGRGGALVAGVSGGGPGERAGLRARDVIVAFGKRRIVDAAELQQAAAALGAGGAMKLTVVRPDRERGLTHGYMDAVRRIRRLDPAEVGGLIPELAELLDDSHFVLRAPDPSRELPAGRAQLLRIARGYSVRHEFDEAARIYLHILASYPKVARDRYNFLLGEIYAAKAQRLAKLGRKAREQRRALLESEGS